MSLSSSSYLESYLEPLKTALSSTHTIEVAVNADGQVWVECQGDAAMRKMDQIMPPEAVRNLAQSLVGETNGKLSDKSPMASGTISYNNRPVRFQTIIPPALPEGAVISLRLFGDDKLKDHQFEYLGLKSISIEKINKNNILDNSLDDIPQTIIKDELNVIVSGGTSTGKTTLVKHLLRLIPQTDRLITIEDAPELFPDHPNTVSLISERGQQRTRSPSALLQATLRLRPDRVILGELRGTEAFTFIEAINTGHGGSVTTLHAETATRALDRLAMMVLQAGTTLTYSDVHRYVSEAIDVVIHLGRHQGRRGIVEMKFLRADQEGVIQ
ncbi:ATPase, T2SS/T4P/T4SS family [Cognatishimia sp. MH4019]|uniref:ATPase, T2SS/T4P/T4SS family n=1 Tax=Cognatishimia sp. MH4019 TaxID=2854030 RepID=UPI001CD3EEB8|nr:ATPase, T2SS/T4P/T4SS family [Cognatishimia sp. MH4019]